MVIGSVPLSQEPTKPLAIPQLYEVGLQPGYVRERRKRLGVLQAEDLRAWIRTHSLSQARAAEILDVTDRTIAKWVRRKTDYLPEKLSIKLEAVRHKLPSEVLRPASGRQVQLHVYAVKAGKRSTYYNDAYNWGLEMTELEFYRFWSAGQCRKHELLLKARQRTLRQAESEELHRLKPFQIQIPAGCCVVHKPSGIRVTSGSRDAFRLNRRHAMARMGQAVDHWLHRVTIEARAAGALDAVAADRRVPTEFVPPRGTSTIYTAKRLEDAEEQEVYAYDEQ